MCIYIYIFALTYNTCTHAERPTDPPIYIYIYIYAHAHPNILIYMHIYTIFSNDFPLNNESSIRNLILCFNKVQCFLEQLSQLSTFTSLKIIAF